MKFKNWVVHPVLFAVYPILFYYSHNMGQVSHQSIISPLSITLASTLVGWSVLRTILKDWYRSGGIVSLFLVLFFSYGLVRSNTDIENAAYILPVLWISIMFFGTFAVLKSKTKFLNGTKILNFASLVLITLVVANISVFQIKSGGMDHVISTRDVLNERMGKDGPDSFPDIYFIVLDAYAREDVLSDIYAFDNSDFIDFLGNKGFYVADKAISNYGQTGLSIGSSLNFEYLDEWVEKHGKKIQSRKTLNAIIQDSQAIRFLREQGYKVVAFASTRPETEIKNADVFLNSGITVNEFHEGLKNATPLPDIPGSDEGEDIFTKYRKHAYFMFDKLGKVASEWEGPKFVFAHFELPHPPFVFGPDGEPVQLESRFNDHDGNSLISRGRLSVQQYREHYRDQLIFVNMKMKHVITEILENSKRPPILLIFGDHGPRSGLNWESAELTDVKESLTMLSAFHLPGGGNELLYPEISPVNSFRIIFNHYFATDLELLPDRSYFSPAQNMYKFQDVTDRVRQPNQ